MVSKEGFNKTIEGKSDKQCDFVINNVYLFSFYYQYYIIINMHDFVSAFWAIQNVQVSRAK